MSLFYKSNKFHKILYRIIKKLAELNAEALIISPLTYFLAEKVGIKEN